MSIMETLTIAKVIETGDLTPFRFLSPSDFGSWEDTWEWITEYEAKHGQVPSEGAIVRRCGAMTLPDVSGESAQGLADEFAAHLEFRTRSEMQQELGGAVPALVEALTKGPISGDSITGDTLALAACQDAFVSAVFDLQDKITSSTGHFGLESVPWDAPVDPEVPLIDNFIFGNTIVMMHGDSGSYKSFLALDMALCIATGTPFLGMDVETAPVLYYSTEGGLSAFKTRATAWVSDRGVTPSSEALRVSTSPPNLREDVQVQKVIKEARAMGAGLVIFDIFAHCIPGADENHAPDMNMVMTNLRRIQTQTGASVMFVHHDNKMGGFRGSTALQGASDAVFQTKKAAAGSVTLRNTKQKNIALRSDVNLAPKTVGDSIVMDRCAPLDPTAAIEDVLRVHGAGLTQKEIAALSGVNQSTVSRKLPGILDDMGLPKEKRNYSYGEEGAA